MQVPDFEGQTRRPRTADGVYPPTRIGFLPLGSPSSDLLLVEAFRKGARDAGLLLGVDTG